MAHAAMGLHAVGAVDPCVALAVLMHGHARSLHYQLLADKAGRKHAVDMDAAAGLQCAAAALSLHRAADRAQVPAIAAAGSVDSAAALEERLIVVGAACGVAIDLLGTQHAELAGNEPQGKASGTVVAVQHAAAVLL